MEINQKETVGVDIVENRYVICLLDGRGMDPRYYKGRVDTPLGQANFFSKVGPRRLIMPSSSLAVLAAKLLDSAQLVVKDELQHYGAWEAAGIQRGERMARFAALLLYRIDYPSDALTDKQKNELMVIQDAELAFLLAVAEASQGIAQEVLSGQADDKTFAKALANEAKSRQDPNMQVEIPKPLQKSPFSDDDTGFLAMVYRALKNL